MDQVDKIRPFSGWFHRPMARKFYETTRTQLPIDEEYWLALRYPAEVESTGMALFKDNNSNFDTFEPEDKRNLWLEFRAYIRQAEVFYRGACVLPWKSSPLNYYYSFMNLAKALAVVRGLLCPKRMQDIRKIKHGITSKPIAGNPDVWKVTVQGPGEIFTMLYQLIIGTQIDSNTELNAIHLLGYSAPIGWQIQKLNNITKIKWFPCYRIILTQPNNCWDIIGLLRDVSIDLLPDSFCAAYEEVSADGAKTFAFKTLRLHAYHSATFRFLQRKNPIHLTVPGKYDISELDRSFNEMLPHHVFEHVNNTEFQFGLGIPYETEITHIPMNEFVASYAIMFFLSSLVRYYPDYMDSIGESANAWLVESFIKSAPLHLIRYMVSAILGYTLIIETI